MTSRKPRSRRESTRPEDQPIFTNPTGLDFEKRAIFFPPGFIDEIVLKGGDEYVKAEDLATLVRVIIVGIEQLRREIVQIKLHLGSISDENIGDKDAD